MTHPSAFVPPRHAARRLAAVALAAIVLTGCAGGRQAIMAEWPEPPETARVRYVRAYNNASDLPGGFWRTLWRALVPHDSRASIRQPTGLALSPDEKTLYVACAPANRVVAIGLDTGEFEIVANAPRNTPGVPHGVATDADGSLYVSDSGSRQVFVFDLQGQFLRKFGDDRLQRPTALALDRARQILYVLDVPGRAGEHRVEAYSLRGEHLRTIGKRGEAPGEFNFPSALAVAPDGRLFVSDMLNFRVQALDGEGRPLAQFGQLGAAGPGYFDKIKGLAFDSFGNIYVVEGAQSLVQISNEQFRPLMAFGGPVQTARRPFFTVPNAIAISSTNRVYVADYAENRVSEFQLVNTAAGDSLRRPATPEASGSGTSQP